MATIRNLMIKVGADFSNAQKGFAKASRDLKKTGRNLQKSGRTMTKGLTVPILGAVAGLATLTIKAGKAADELNTLSNKTGISTDALQEMEYASRIIDTSLESMTGSMMKLTKNMDMARQGGKDQKEAFEQLGVVYKNNDGTLRNSKDVWYDAIDALGNVANEAERDAMAMRLFGRSAAEMNPLIKAGSKELKRLGVEARDVGAVMGKESLDKLQQFDDSMQKLQAVFKVAAGEIAVAFLPVMEKLEPLIKRYIIPAIKNFAQWLGNMISKFENLSPTMKKVVGMLLALVVAIGPLMTIGGKMLIMVSGIVGAFGRASKAMKAGQSAMSGLLTPAGKVMLVLTAIAAVVTVVMIALNKGTEETQKLTSEFKNIARASADARAEFSKKVDTMNAESEATKKLTSELYELQRKENKSNVEKQRMSDLVNELNRRVPDLNLAIDEQTGLLNLNEKAVMRVVSAKKEEAKANAYATEYARLTAEQYRLENELAKAREVHAKLQEKYAGVDTGKLWNSAARKEMKLARDAAGALYTELQATSDALIVVSGEWDKATEAEISALNEQNDALSENVTLTEEELEAKQKAIDDFALQIEAGAKEHLDEMGDIFDEEIEMYDITAEQVAKNLEKQTEQFENWGGLMERVARRVPDDVADGLRDLGPQATPILEDLLSMTSEELDEWVGIWQGKTEAAVDASVNELNQSEAQKAGEDFAKDVTTGMAIGFANSELDAIRAASRVANKVKGALAHIFKISSPSKVTTKMGEQVTEGLSLGMKNKARMAMSQASAVASGVVNSMRLSPIDTAGVMSNGMTKAYVSAGAGDDGMYDAFTRALRDNKTDNSDIKLIINGHEVATAIVEPMDKALQRKRTNATRAGG